MLLLAIDTSGKNGGVALAQWEGENCEVLESSPIAGGTFSAQLVPQIAEALNQRNLKAADLNALIAISGPGSFTGLRVGLAAIKGLAEILQIPIVAISLLELMALESAQEGTVLALLDAGRSEYYCGEYEVRGRRAKLVREFLAGLEQAVALAAEGKFSVITVDKGIATTLQQHSIAFREISRPGSAAAAFWGYKKLLAGERTSIEELDANYIRRSDAEIFSKPKLQQKWRE